MLCDSAVNHCLWVPELASGRKVLVEGHSTIPKQLLGTKWNKKKGEQRTCPKSKVLSEAQQWPALERQNFTANIGRNF